MEIGGSAFWLCMVAILVSVFLSALDLTGIATILPTIAAVLDGGDRYVWVGSAYTLSSAAILPLIGGLANIFGRRPVMVACLILFAIGSALAGAAKNMDMLIAARAVQGMGGGGLLATTNIVISDLVPLSQRGVYQGFLSLTFALGTGVSPIIGGALVQKASWRWFFYINLPVTSIALFLVVVFMKVRTPEGSTREKLGQIDWFGNLIIIAGATLSIIGLTWGGSRYSWSSAHVLAPLLIGLALIAAFVVYEAYIPKHPTIPFKVLVNRTSVAGYIATALHGITSISFICNQFIPLDYMPVYFQAVLGASPLRAGVDVLANSLFVTIFGLFGGIAVKVTKQFIPVNMVGWIFAIIGFGLTSLLNENVHGATWVGNTLLASIGTGIIFSCTVFPILAPLPVALNASALAFFTFIRVFAQTWGIAISGTILQNQLKQKIPQSFLSTFPDVADLAFAAIPEIHTLPEPLRTEVQKAFAESLSTVWKVMIGIAGAGFLSTLLLKEVTMHSATDDRFGLNGNDTKLGDEEKARDSELEVSSAQGEVADGKRSEQ
ncbi:iron permease [Abortiporus biennis]|nr:iron permease [Abortiporus biennis]